MASKNNKSNNKNSAQSPKPTKNQPGKIEAKSVDLSSLTLHGEGLVVATVWLISQMQEQYNLDVKSNRMENAPHR